MSSYTLDDDSKQSHNSASSQLNAWTEATASRIPTRNHWLNIVTTPSDGPPAVQHIEEVSTASHKSTADASSQMTEQCDARDTPDEVRRQHSQFGKDPLKVRSHRSLHMNDDHDLGLSSHEQGATCRPREPLQQLAPTWPSKQNPSSAHNFEIYKDDEVNKRESAAAIASMANLLNGTGADEGRIVTWIDIQGIKPFTAQEIVDRLEESKYRLGRNGLEIVKALLEDANAALHLEVILPWANDLAHLSSGIPHNFNINMDQRSQPFSVLDLTSPNPNNPTGQWPKDFETILLDADGTWVIKFEKRLANGTVYCQTDPLPTWDSSKKPAQAAGDGQAESAADAGDPAPPKEFVRGQLFPDLKLIPQFPKSDSGTWVAVPEQTGQYVRQYQNPNAKEQARVGAVARPFFVVRKFDPDTGRYLEQYKWGKAWSNFDVKVGGFDINDRSCVEKANAWQRQLHDRGAIDYQKRPTRESWKPHELRALRGNFNDLIEHKGLIKLYLNPEFDQALAKINQARREKDRKLAPADRNQEALEAQCKRESYAHNVARLGIQEWRELGHVLLEFREGHPGIVINDRWLKPKNAVSLDCMSDEKATKRKSSVTEVDVEAANRLAADTYDEITDSGPKLMPVVENGVLKLTDRFGGDLVRKLFSSEENLVNQAGESEGPNLGGQEQQDVMQGDQQENPPSSKKREPGIRSMAAQKRKWNEEEEYDEGSEEGEIVERIPKRAAI